jgi:hypothetical protein
LLTSAREAPRSGAKQEATSGSPESPDERLDRADAPLFNPKKLVPATVEFADMGGATTAKAGAAALLDVAAVPQRGRTPSCRFGCFAIHQCRTLPAPSIPRAMFARWKTK